MSTKTYIYTREKSSKRGYNLCLMVYRMKRNVPTFIGDVDINTGSYKGDRASVYKVISESENIPMDGAYYITGDVEIHQVGSGYI